MNRSASNDRAPFAGLPGVARSSAFASAKGVLLRWFVALVAVVAVSSFAAIHLTRPELTPITSDGFDYYVYLPDWFLFHETTLQAVADDCCGGRYPDWTAMTRSPRTGRWLNPHPIGVAVLTAPFFGLAHGLTLWSGLPPDGFSLYYQCAAALAGLSFMLGGLAILRTLLRTHVTDGVALATLAALTFGTNLFHYGVFDATYSHAFSFGLVCALMALAESWWERPRPWRTVGLGLVAGLLVLVRHPNALLLVVVPLVGLTWKEGARQWLARAYERRWQVAAALAIAAFVVAPQVALYRAAAGSWLANPYGAAGGSFAFLSSPRIAGVLFSVQKGLFFWSPVLLLALPAIAYSGRGANLEGGRVSWAANWRAAAVVVLAVQTYLLASWHDWQLGGSYGHRGYTDLLALFAPFLAATFSWAAARRGWRRWTVVVAAALAVGLSVLMMVQYWRGAVPIADTTWAQYKELFLKW